MTDSSGNVFEILVKPLRRLVEQRGFKVPTEPQAKTIPKILDGKNVLLISPTATGKTEAAILPVLNMLLLKPERAHGIKVVYVTPLRALNRDLLERLQYWCNNLDVKLAVRHGDTTTQERNRQARSPPDILITTPETLQAILPGRLMRQHLRHVRWVIIDEVHEMADSKRGSQLSLALERLRWVTGKEYQLIGLSATIGSPKRVGQFLVGNGREVEIVRVSISKLMELDIVFPRPETADHELALNLFTHPEVAARLRLIRQFIEKHKSVLLFTNTRSISEVLASRFKVWDMDFPVSIHHGSLAKPSRIAAERGLKNGELKGLVATSSLELGIDVGRIDMVVQYMSPRQVTRLIQRVGRSGHRIGRISKGLIVTMDSDDTLEAMAIARMAREETLEPVKVPPKPYDALAHQMIGLLMEKKRWYFHEIFDLFRKAYPYADLTLDDIQKILEYMHSRFPRFAWVSKEDMLVIKPRQTKPIYKYYFENLSMIPDQKKFLVIEESKNSAIGVLDEAFVAEYGKPGVKFIIRGSPWKILSVYGDQIHVKQVDDPTGAIPSWVGEEIPVPFEVAQEVGWIRNFVEEQIDKGVEPEKIAIQLTERYPAGRDTVIRAIDQTVEQVKKNYLVPSNKRILVEDWEDVVIIHANFGSLTNRTLAQLIGYLVSEKTGYSAMVQHDPYRIFVHGTGATGAKGIVALLREMKNLSETSIRDSLTKATIRTGLFKRRLIHVGRRFGAIKKHVDIGMLTLARLVKSFEGTAIYDEALKETFTKDLDLEHTIQLLKNMRKGEIEIAKLETTGIATPIARIGIEKVRMKTDLIPSEKMKRILVESARVRLLNETRTFACTSCWRYLEMLRISDLPEKPICPNCGSKNLGLLSAEEEKVQSLIDKEGESTSKREAKIKQRALSTARLMETYGKQAAIALSGKKIRVADAKKILAEESTLSDKFFELIVEAERDALKRRFW